MEFTTSQNNHDIRFTINGDIDEKGAADLKAGFEGLKLSNQKNIIFDFAKVTYIGSAGLGKLLLFYKNLATAGIEMRVENSKPEIRDLLKELHLDTLFTVS